MAARQQEMIKCLCKYCRQYFLFKEDPSMDDRKVRLRSSTQRVEQAPQEDIDAMLKQRLSNWEIGMLNPQHVPYEPVCGWPVTSVDELVLTALADHLDPRAAQAVKNQFAKVDVKRIVEKREGEELLKDASVIHSFPLSGYNLIKAHLAESEARMYNVKAGYDFQQHFLRTQDIRLKKLVAHGDGLQQFDDQDSDFVKAKERVRADSITFLETLKELLEYQLALRVRHLMSHVPINLALLGTPEDRQASSIRGPPVQQYTGGTPVRHSFRDQIVTEAPASWPVRTRNMSKSNAGRLMKRNTFSSDRARSVGAGSLTPTPRMADQTSPTLPSSQNPNNTFAICGYVLMGIGKLKLEEGDPTAKIEGQAGSGVVSEYEQTHKQFRDRFRKRWPPVWMSMASMEQGQYVVDPQCPTREFNACLKSQPPRHRRSMHDVLATRGEWALMRKTINKDVDEALWREDKEKMDMYHVQFSALANVGVSRPYPTHQRNVFDRQRESRCTRQKTGVYDCELTVWYKLLVVEIQAEVGTKDREINELLEGIKQYFKMSATSPKLGKAKLALITMSLPAYVILRLPVQRALAFILRHVLQAPLPLLIGWLTVRGLPLVINEKTQKGV